MILQSSASSNYSIIDGSKSTELFVQLFWNIKHFNPAKTREKA